MSCQDLPLQVKEASMFDLFVVHLETKDHELQKVIYLTPNVQDIEDITDIVEGKNFSYGSEQDQKCKIVDRWVSSAGPEMVLPLYNCKDLLVWVGKLQGSQQRVIAPIQGHDNAFRPFTLNIGKSNTCDCASCLSIGGVYKVILWSKP